MYNEKPIVLKQLLSSNSNRCGVCNATLKNKIRYSKICVYNDDFSQYDIVKASMIECPNCFCLNAVKEADVKYNNSSFKPSLFSFNTQELYPYIVTKLKLSYQKTCDTFPNNSTPINISIHKKFVEFFKKHNNTIFISELFSTNFKSNSNSDIYNNEIIPIPCPICKKPLNIINAPIYNEKNEFFKLTGKSCGKHFFIKRFGKKFEHLTVNKILNLDYTFFINISKNYVDCFNEPVAICLQSLTDYKIIVVGSEYILKKHYTVISYKEYSSRLLLSKIFHEKCLKIEYEKHLYDNILVSNIDTTSPYEIEIKKNGGISMIDNCELIDILLYSPYTKAYEIARASYNRKNRSFYIDKSIYKNFLKKYGDPGIIVYNLSLIDNSTINMWREESPLYSYGYSVNQKDNLSDSMRHMILKNIVDSKKLSKEEIISHLNNCINFKKNNDRFAVACRKWQNDIEFLVNYNTSISKLTISE